MNVDHLSSLSYHDLESLNRAVYDERRRREPLQDAAWAAAFAETLAEDVRKARGARGLTVPEAADLAGIAPRTLRSVERGKRSTMSTVWKLEQVFGKEAVIRAFKKAGEAAHAAGVERNAA